MWLALPLTLGTAAVLLAAVATLAVAVLVLALAFAKPVHRAFALFLLVKALVDGSLAFTSEVSDLPARLRVYWFIGLPFAAAHFALVYRWRYRLGTPPRPLTRRLALAAIVAAAALCEVLYALDHSLFGSPPNLPGPFLAFAFLPWPTYAAVALLFAREAARTRGAGRSAFVPAALGMSLPPLFFSSFRAFDLALGTLNGNPNAFQFPIQVAEGLAHVVTLGLLGMVAWHFRSLRGAQRTVGSAPLAWGVALASAFAAALANALLGDGGASSLPVVLLQGFLAAWSLAIPLLVTYALVRYRLFGVDVRFTIKASTLAGLFVAVFLVVDQLVQALSSQAFGAVAGAIAAGLLLFAIHPLQRFAERLARKAAPQSTPPTALPRDDRLALFREQLELAWGDGVLTRKERLLFDRLRTQLGISGEEAALLESEVLRGAARPPQPAPEAAPA